MKDTTKTYHVKHDFGHTEISLPKEGHTVNLNINMTFQTFVYLIILIGFSSLVVTDWIKLIIK